ncbi:hypothetical protein CUMW_210130 [Citrus unshiu]|uniref:Uncharacterized protein n=1 Tax=Citrus unshiu TaxID=55188 RepID=A0A2H5Q9Y4_CITUN|nr:hypothetical protein CUMW_210130 [Citrus unshiu]
MQMKLEEKLNLDIIPNFANGPKADIRKGFRKLFSAKEFLYEETAKEVISDEKTYNAREFSKILSECMLYLLVLKPTMLFQEKYQAKRMVDKLQSLHCYKDKKWEIVSKVRVELISYAACHSRSTRTHVEQVSNGGELFTFVWVLMAHFGHAEPKSED